MRDAVVLHSRDRDERHNRLPQPSPTTTTPMALASSASSPSNQTPTPHWSQACLRWTRRLRSPATPWPRHLRLRGVIAQRHSKHQLYQERICKKLVAHFLEPRCLGVECEGSLSSQLHSTCHEALTTKSSPTCTDARSVAISLGLAGRNSAPSWPNL